MKSKVVVSLVPGRLVVELVDDSVDVPVVKREVIKWKKGSLDDAFLEVTSKFKQAESFRVIVSDKLCHVTGLVVEKQYSSDRKYIKSKVSELVPEDLDIVKWDYVKKNIVDGDAQIQVFVFSKLLNDEFNNLSFKIKKKIKLILPTSLVLLGSFLEKDQSFLLIHTDEVDQVMVAVINGIVKFTVTFNEQNVYKKVLDSIFYIANYLNFSLDTVALSGVVNEELTRKLKENFQVASVQTIPVLNILKINKVSGSDQKILNISFSNTKKDITLPHLEDNLENTVGGDSKQSLIIIFILIIIAILGLVMLYLFV